MLPKKVGREVNDRVSYTFNMGMHTQLWKHFRVRPDARPTATTVTDDRYCVVDEPTNNYVYTRAWVDKIVREVGTPEKYQALFGHFRA